ncbi:hypothetical protein RhiJN_25304 [Ceratobasidium sp. AG-Ba]|nr:hypothetical protein RhiJN_25304 [Ceratobasidium sp. AG-Ba]
MDSAPEQRPTHRERRRKRHGLSDSISLIGSYTIGWAAPTEQVKFLNDNGDDILWVGFRDGFMSKWTNLNIVCGLIMGAISTIVFAGLELDSVTFGFGIVSLLSSLISIGFGTGLMYVLGNVPGSTLGKIGKRHPILFIFALSIPQVWAGVCIVSFFLCVGVFAWNATDKGWTAKAGIIGSSALTAIHLILFARLFYKQNNIATLIDDHPEGGVDDNFHLTQLKGSGNSDTQSATSSPPRQRPYVTQYGGSGVGHYRPSPPDRHLPSRPLVESPDANSQVFPMRKASHGSPPGRVRTRSNEDALEEPVDLFAASERLAGK